jgi:hypothetical protein
MNRTLLHVKIKMKISLSSIFDKKCLATTSDDEESFSGGPESTQDMTTNASSHWGGVYAGDPHCDNSLAEFGSFINNCCNNYDNCLGNYEQCLDHHNSGVDNYSEHTNYQCKMRKNRIF